MAMNVGMLSSYDQAKQITIEYVTKDQDPKKPSLKTSLISSAVAGVTCAVGSLPFDVIKSRVMFQKKDPVTGEYPYKGVLDCIRKTYRNEGFLAFWKGLPAYYVRSAPHAMVILMSVEQITKLYRKAFGLDGGDNFMTVLRYSTHAVFQNYQGDGDEDEDDDDFSAEAFDENEKRKKRD